MEGVAEGPRVLNEDIVMQLLCFILLLIMFLMSRLYVLKIYLTIWKLVVVLK